jgi:putative membrane protein
MQRTEARPQIPAQPEKPVPPSAPQVDLRILQANERTLLAWVRTGLALMAFGFVVARISPWLSEAEVQPNSLWSVWTGAAFLVLGTVCNIAAAVRFVRIRAAVLEGRSVVPGRAAVLSLALGLALLGGFLAVHVLLH